MSGGVHEDGDRRPATRYDDARPIGLKVNELRPGLYDRLTDRNCELDVRILWTAKTVEFSLYDAKARKRYTTEISFSDFDDGSYLKLFSPKLRELCRMAGKKMTN